MKGQMKVVTDEDRAYIRELISESYRRKRKWQELTFERIAEKFEVSKRTVERIADEVRI